MAAKPRRTLSKDECADELGISTDTLKRYANEGCPCTHARSGNLYDVAEVMAWMQANGKTGKPGRPTENESSPGLEAAKLRKENALASKYELQVAREKRELLNATDVKRWVNEHVGSLRTRLMGLGDELTPAMEGRDSAERAELINGRVRDLLEELSREAERLGIDSAQAAANAAPG